MQRDQKFFLFHNNACPHTAAIISSFCPRKKWHSWVILHIHQIQAPPPLFRFTKMKMGTEKWPLCFDRRHSEICNREIKSGPNFWLYSSHETALRSCQQVYSSVRRLFRINNTYLNFFPPFSKRCRKTYRAHLVLIPIRCFWILTLLARKNQTPKNRPLGYSNFPLHRYYLFTNSGGSDYLHRLLTEFWIANGIIPIHLAQGILVKCLSVVILPHKIDDFKVLTNISKSTSHVCIRLRLQKIKYKLRIWSYQQLCSQQGPTAQRIYIQLNIVLLFHHFSPKRNILPTRNFG